MRSSLFIICLSFLFTSCDFMCAYGDLVVENHTDCIFYIYSGDDLIGSIDAFESDSYYITTGTHHIRAEESGLFGSEHYYNVDVSCFNESVINLDSH
ncbi:MAG: hypothetical protein MK081_10350 [Flavobacteriales bacterium]|nr:hypothetical protein [Flavobacteriales bacterium]